MTEGESGNEEDNDILKKWESRLTNIIPRERPTKDKIDDKLAEYEEQNTTDELKCTQCNKNFDGAYHYFSLEKSEKDTTNNTLRITERKLFCSPECLKAFKDNNDVNDYDFFEILRCSSFYDCERLNNLRKMCEKVEPILDNPSYLSYIRPVNFCEPGIAGIIRSSVEINETQKKFARNSDKQFSITKKMTVLVIILTLINIATQFYSLSIGLYTIAIIFIVSFLIWYLWPWKNMLRK